MGYSAIVLTFAVGTGCRSWTTPVALIFGCRPVDLQGLSINDHPVLTQCMRVGHLFLFYVFENPIWVSFERVSISPRTRHLASENLSLLQGTKKFGRQNFGIRSWV